MFDTQFHVESTIKEKTTIKKSLHDWKPQVCVCARACFYYNLECPFVNIFAEVQVLVSFKELANVKHKNLNTKRSPLIPRLFFFKSTCSLIYVINI